VALKRIYSTPFQVYSIVIVKTVKMYVTHVSIVLTEARRKTIVTAMYLSIAAILGTFLRIAMAQLFGDACANPGTVGWLKASSPLCVTKDGSSEREGGIVFAVSIYKKISVGLLLSLFFRAHTRAALYIFSRFTYSAHNVRTFLQIY
jgi:hypothetical protein